MRDKPTVNAHVVSLRLHHIGEVIAGLSFDPLHWLTGQEKSRLDHTPAGKARDQFLAGRWAVRHLLATRAGGAWQAYGLSAPTAGPPLVVGASGNERWHVSISHSGDWLACAVAPHPVGVDVEVSTRRRDFSALNEWVHAPVALSEWGGMSDAKQQAWFYAQWTLKEAWFKQASAASPHLAITPADMKAAIFIRAMNKSAGTAHAMTASNGAITLAVYPATADNLQVELPDAGCFDWLSWAVPARA